MKRLLVVTLLFLFCTVFTPAAATAQSSKPITQHGLVESLRLGGLKTGELVGILNKRGVDFLLTVQIQDELVQAGATPEVLDAVRNNYRGADDKIVEASTPSSSPPPPPPPRSSSSPAPQAVGIYTRQGGTWVALHQESAQYEAAGFAKAMGKASAGFLKVKGEVAGVIAGAHSSTDLHSPATFLIRMSPGLGANDYLLVHLHAKRDNREFKIAGDQLHSKDDVGYRLIQLSGSDLQIEIAQGAGDYAFVSRNSQPSNSDAEHKTFLYTFQIVP